MGIKVNLVTIKPFNSFPELRHGFSPRCYENGKGERVELYLGRGNENCLEHRRGFLQSIGIDSDEVFLVKQVHGDRVYVMESSSEPSGKMINEEADAIITNLRGRPFGVLTADCVPVILYDPEQKAVGTVHAGRKGTQKRILSKAIKKLVALYGCRPENIRVGMGPAICGKCYEVDEPCLEPFRDNYDGWERFMSIREDGKFFLDLFEANRVDSLSAGILPENIFRQGECTSCDNDKWFSYRREGNKGRVMTLVMLEEK